MFKTANKLILIGAVLLLFALTYASGVIDYLNIENVVLLRQRLRVWQLENTGLTAVIFFLIYVAITALSLPGAAVLTLLSGALFGEVGGLLIASFASTLGATLAFVCARYLLRDALAKKYAKRMHAINQGIERDGLLYLLSARLIPFIPFPVVNIVFALTHVRVTQFALVSQLGMLPSTLIYVYAGSSLAQINSMQDILSVQLVSALILLAFIPWLARWGLKRYRARH